MYLFLSDYICQFNDAKLYLNEVLYGILHKRIVQFSHCLTFKETGDQTYMYAQLRMVQKEPFDFSCAIPSKRKRFTLEFAGVFLITVNLPFLCATSIPCNVSMFIADLFDFFSDIYFG